MAGFTSLTVSILGLALTSAWCVALCLWPLLVVLRRFPATIISAGTWFFLGLLPLISGLLVGAFALGSSLLKSTRWLPDHCSEHLGHPHLCWTHWEQSSSFGGILEVGVILGLALVVFGILKVILPTWSFQRSLAKGETRSEDGFTIVQSPLPAAFVAGILRPKPYLTEATEPLLTAPERAIILAHELEHIRRLDTMRLLILRVVARLFPGFAAVHNSWMVCTEVECDRASLRVGASPEEVSLTLLKVARALGSLNRSAALAYAGGSAMELKLRVESLLDGRVPVRSWILLCFLLILVVLLASLSFSNVHHFLETILGFLRG